MSSLLQRLCASARSAGRTGLYARGGLGRLGVTRMFASAGAWDAVPTAPPDAILGLNQMFREDTRATKVNLGVGAYRTDEGEPYVLPVVRRMEQKLAADPTHNHEYVPQDGLAAFAELSAALILGKESAALAEGRVVTVQALSGTGALRVGMAFVQRFMPAGTHVYLPAPTWSNHRNVVLQANLPDLHSYRYFDPVTKGVDVDGLVEDLRDAPPRSVVLLHGCAHNPTGSDPSPAAWQRILEVVQERDLVPFFDNAYQGFASGSLKKDAYSVQLFADAGVEMIIAQSYAKNMGLYNGRVGALSVVCDTKKPVEAVRSQLKGIIRAMYSNPPVHGAKVAAMIMSDPEAFAEWEGELTIMSGRIQRMRVLLKEALEAIGTPGSWDHITEQIGMFSFTGISSDQVDYIREHYSVYMTSNGRISMAGLNEKNVAYVAKAMREAIVNVPQ